MNLNKAKQILTRMGTPEFDGHTEDILTARKIGVAAIERLQVNRKQTTIEWLTLLPGETKD